MTYRVVRWSTGGVGRAGDPRDRPAARPRAGRRVGAQRREGRASTPATLAGIEPLGVAAPPTPTRCSRSRPTASVTRRSGESRPTEAVADYARMLEAGINVVTVSVAGAALPRRLRRRLA